MLSVLKTIRDKLVSKRFHIKGKSSGKIEFGDQNDKYI